MQPGLAAALPRGGCWWESAGSRARFPLALRPHRSSWHGWGRKGQARGSSPPISFSPDNARTKHFFFLWTRRFGRGSGRSRGSGSFVLRYQHPPSRSRPIPRLCLCGAPPHFLPHRGSPPVPAGRAGRGKRFPRAMTPSYFSPTWRRHWLRGYCRSGSRSLLLRPPSPSPSAAPSPQPFPRPASQLALSLCQERGPSRAAGARACYVRQLGSRAAPTTTSYFAGGRLCARPVDTPEPAHPERWQGERVYSLLAEGGWRGVTAGHCRRAFAARSPLLRSASAPANHTSAFPLNAASKILTRARPAPQLPCNFQ